MKKFKFRLQKVFEHRVRVKEELGRILRLRMNEHAEAVQKLQNLREAQQGLGFTTEGPCDVGTLTLLSAYGFRLKAEIEKQIEVIAEAEQRVAAARADYVKASTDARALELLREKRLVEYNEAILKHECDQIDEMTTQRAGRNRESI